MRKRITFFISCYLFAICFACAQNPNKGFISRISIEGTQYTEMSTLAKSSIAEEFKTRIKENTVKQLSKIFALDSIEFAAEKEIVFKQGLNRFTGVKKLDKSFYEKAAKCRYSFKIKCDIAFNETITGFILQENSSRANIYLSVGVFDSQGKLVDVYKGESKDNVIFIGKNAQKTQRLSIIDFEKAYCLALDNLKKD